MYNKKAGAGVVIIVFVIIVLAVGAYLYGVSFNPEYKGWNPFKGIGPAQVGGNECLISESNCRGNDICISTRACTYSQLTGNCQCTGSTKGVCKDYSGTPAEAYDCGKAVGNAPCGRDYPLCCPGDICVNGKCEPPSGIYSTLSKCASIQEI